jgi:peptide/nickel transport system substrate-binding protein
MAGIGRRRFLAGVAGLFALGAARGRPREPRPRRGGVLKHIGADPPTFDIHAPASYQAQLVSSFVRRGLFKFVHGSRYDPSDFTLVADLAARAAVSGDGRTCTITLRRGVRWERRPPVNGRELVAADVKYSLERALRRWPYGSLLGPVEGIETPTPHTLRVHLRSPFAPFLQSLAEPWTAILPPEVEDEMGDLRSARSLIGCGPFTLERYDPGVKAIFTRNPDYHGQGLPYLDKVEWIFLRDRPTQLSLFRAGQLDIPFYDARIPSEEAESLASSDPPYPVVHWERLGDRALAMRVDRPPFSDVRVRRACSLAVDRTKWLSEEQAGEGLEGGRPVPSPMRQWRLGPGELGEGARYLQHDPALARQLLAEAGFPNGLRVKCANSPGDGPDHAQALARLTADLKRVGVELAVIDEDYESYAKSVSAGRYEESTWDSSPLFSEADSYLYSLYRSGVLTNRSRVADPQLDLLLEAQRRRPAGPVRRTQIDDIQRRAVAQAYYLHAPFPRSIAAWTPRVKNYSPKNSLDRGAQLEVVWVDDA